MEGTEQQPVDVSEGFLPGGIKQPAQATAATTPTPEAPPATPAPEAPVASVNDPVTPEVTDPDLQDPYAQIVEQETSEPQPEVTFTEEELAKIERIAGTKDLKDFVGKYSTTAEKAAMLEAQVNEYSAIKNSLEALPPAFRRAFDMAMEGKVEKAQEFLRDLPATVLTNKEAKDIPSEKLIPAYLGDKMTEEDFAILKDPEADPDEVKAIKAKERHYRDIAADMHERKRQEVMDAQKVESEARQMAVAKYNDGVAQALSTVKNSPYKVLADQGFQQEFQTGAWTRTFVQEDGVTPTPEAAMLLLKVRHHDKLVKAQADAAYKRGREAATKELLSQSGSLPPTSGRQAPAQSGQPTMSLEDQILSRLGKQAAMGTN
jgi:hypothetical protein